MRLFERHRVWTTPYVLAWRVAILLIYSLPLLMLYGALFYMILALLAIAANPGLLVRGAFMLIDALPSYGAFAAKAIWAQVHEELATRMR